MKHKMAWFYNFIQRSCYYFLRIFYDYKVYGAENSYPHKAIIAPNHASFIDPPIVASSWPRELHFLASDYLFKIPILKTVISNVNTHPVQRGKADLSSIKLICQLLNEGKQVIIFPEGTRSMDGNLAPLKNGIGLLAYKSHAAVIPAYIHGSYQIWNRKSSFPKLWGKTAIVYGTPIFFEEFAHLDSKQFQQALLEKLRDSILNLKKWYDEGAQGSPP